MLAILLSTCAPTETITIFYNGVIHTINNKGETVGAIAVQEGKIVSMGTSQELLSTYHAEHTVDLDGKHVFPGFIDAHAHLFGLGEEALTLQLGGVTEMDSILALIQRDAARKVKGIWILGRGWDQNTWARKQFPTKFELDKVATVHPVFLRRIDGHAAWVNSEALRYAGINKYTPDPSGGKILRSPDGEPTGILLDNAVDLVRNCIPAYSVEQMKAAYQMAMTQCLSLGMTGMHDMGVERLKINALKNLVSENKLPFRIVAYIDGRIDEWEDLLLSGKQVFGDNKLTLAGLKIYADGALGSRGALLFEEYADDPGNKGLQISNQDTIRFEATRALKKDLQICVHAIGDAANTIVLNAYELAMEQSGLKSEGRLRIEHVQVLQESDIGRFVQLGIIPSMQPTHCTSDMYWAESRVGPERIKRAYAWRSLLKTGVWIPGGSDFPIERPNPLWGIYAASTRQNHESKPKSEKDIVDLFQRNPSKGISSDHYKNGWYAEQKMTRIEAVKAFTIWAAKAARMDALIGSLEVGKYADFVVLSDDILSIPAPQILTTKVLATYVSGKCEYSQ